MIINNKIKIKKTNDHFYEKKYLFLNSKKVKQKIKWNPILSFSETIKLTADWYKKYLDKKNMEFVTKSQVVDYLKNIMENKIFKENFSVNPRIYKTINFKDHRGSFDKIFSKELLSFLKKLSNTSRRNKSLLHQKKGTLRGMHFQIGRYKEDKIITCLKGKIFDVVVDLRKKIKKFS